MELHICGTRGSTVQTGTEFARYGGDTSCYLVTGSGGERLLLDAGSGAAGAGALLRESPGARRLTALFTHYHLDHVQGLPSLPQLYDAEWELELLGPAAKTGGEATLRSLLTPPLWPLAVESMAADIRFAALAEGELRRGGLSVRHCALPHPGGALAFRVDEEGGGAFVLATDLEWPRADGPQREALLSLCAEPRPVDLLLCDGQFDAEDYPEHAGWGHSRLEDAVDIARTAEAGRLLVIHHSPESTDRQLSIRDSALQALAPGAALARQGMTIEL